MSSVTVGRMNVACHVAREHPNPQKVQRRLNEALQPERLAGLLRAVIQNALPADDAVWFLRRLDLELALDIGRTDDGALADLVARQLAARVVRLVREAPEGDAVVFPNRDAYSAHFVGDLLAGRAWDRWYYQEFDGLRSLLLPQAIREALLREPARTEGILIQLQVRQQLELALAVMSDRDLGRVYAACRHAAGPPAPASRPIADRLLALWRHTALAPDEGWSAPANHLRLWLAARGEAAARGELPPPALHATITLLLHVAELLHHPACPPQVVPLLAAGRPAEAAAAVRPIVLAGSAARLPELSALAEADGNWLRKAASVLGPQNLEATVAPAGFNLASPCAGLFLLLPTVADLHLDRLLGAHAPDESVAAVWRYWLLLKCLSAVGRDAARQDQALLLATGLASPPTAEALAAAVEAASSARLSALQRDFLVLLLEQGRAAGQQLAVAAAPSPDGEMLAVVRDTLHDYWLALAPREKIEKALLDLAAQFGAPPTRVWQEGDPISEDAAPAFARRAKPVAPDLATFHLAELPPPLDWLLTVLAQAVLRTFARRLMGFAWSSPAHLHANFLAGRGRVQVLPEMITVELAPAPLHTVLRLAGFHGYRYAIPWLEGRQVELMLGAAWS